MAWVVLADGARRETGGTETPLLTADDIAALTGYHVADGTLCRGDRCVRLPDGAMADGAMPLPRLAELLGLPAAIEPSARAAALGEAAEDRAQVLRGGAAPDFALMDAAGRQHRLSDYRGRKILLVTWASWCGCREDLPAWQALHDELAETGLVIMTVSQDIRPAEALPYIEAAQPAHPALLDPGQIVSQRYGLINVPTAIWIDEEGGIARPPRVEHATNTFSFAHGLDCEPHLAALRRWARGGPADHSAADTASGTAPPSAAEQQARAHHALALHLHEAGLQEDAERHWAEAIRLSPYDWTIRRGSMRLRGADPFGAEFAEAWMEWENAGRPDYAKFAAERAA